MLSRAVVTLVLRVNIAFLWYVVGISCLCEVNCGYSALDTQLVYSNEGGKRGKLQVLHWQARDLVYKVYSYVKREADAIYAPPAFIVVGPYTNYIWCSSYQIMNYDAENKKTCIF